MLTLHDCSADYTKISPHLGGKMLPPNIVWVDIFNGTHDEVAFVERASGMHIPTLADLSEIESSSRLRTINGALCLSAPLVTRTDSGMAETSSVGFILTKKLLITVRFAEFNPFKTFAQELGAEAETKPCTSAGVFVGLMDAIIDRAADILEQVGSELDIASQRVFRVDTESPEVQERPARASADLRQILRRIGRNGDLASKIRDSLLGIGRIVPYAAGVNADWFSADLRARLETQRHDIMSLSDYDGHLTNKVQLLLDATLGLINIEQNNIIKVLTIVSVVGVPPTLIASLYGMNFHDMPELSWTYGYPYGLAMIALSAVLPLVWFRIRGWL